MSTSFSEAALDRIAECASSETVTPGVSPVAALLERYFKRDPEHGLADEDFPDGFDDMIQIFGGDSEGIFHLEEANEFYRFAGLLELAIRVGYVNLSTWNAADELQRALRHFLERESASEKSTDLTLISALIARLERNERCVTTRDNAAFFAFASLLHLTNCVRDDREALQFFHESTRTWSVGEDLPFVLTPRHFAEAVTFRTVAGLESKTVTRGLAALRYLQWFAEILERVKHVDGLAEDFVRQARWSHHTPAVRRRVDIWAERMSEWAESGVDREGEEAWEQFKQAVLFPIERYLKSVRPDPVQETPNEAHLVPMPDTPSIEALYAEGRIGAARKLARQDAEGCSKKLKNAAEAFEKKFGKKLDAQSSSERSKNADAVRQLGEELISACERLAQMGEVDTAAVIVAPFVEKLRFVNSEAVQKLLADGRSASWPVPPSPTKQPASAQEAPFFAAQSKQRSVGGEEQASFTAS